MFCGCACVIIFFNPVSCIFASLLSLSKAVVKMQCFYHFLSAAEFVKHIFHNPA